VSPTPLIELQRRLAEAGRIRMGEKSEKGAPKRLTTWRITSPTKGLVEQAAGLYGGEPKPWESPTGPQWEVVTTTADLPVLVMPGYSFRQGYEFRTSPTLVERRCDGVEMDDGQPCLCNAEGDDKCALLTRLTVALPELTTMLGWRLETKGDNAARELLASMDLVQGVAGGRPFVPARLRIVERRGNVNGQAVRYVVPVIDVSIRYSEVLGGGAAVSPSAALPTGYTPIPSKGTGNGVSLEQGLLAAETQTLAKPPRVPLVEDDEILDDESGGPAQPPLPEAPQTPSGDHTKAQAKKLNVLVGNLRDAGHITTENLYAALANSRSLAADDMIALLEGARDEEGQLHWGPLRDSLSKDEASNLIERLERLEANVKAIA
jgi:hypothetical protein